MFRKFISLLTLVSLLVSSVPGITALADDGTESSDGIFFQENFNSYTDGEMPSDSFIIQRAGSADISVVSIPDAKNKSLCLKGSSGGQVQIDKNIFNPEKAAVTLSFRFCLDNTGSFNLVYLKDDLGIYSPVFNVVNGKLMQGDNVVSEFEKGRWYYVELIVNTKGKNYGVKIDGDKVLKRQAVSISGLSGIRFKLENTDQRLYLDDVNLMSADANVGDREYFEYNSLFLSNVQQMEYEDIVSDSFVMYRNSTKAMVNGATVEMPAPPKEFNKIMYLPVRFVGEKLGAEVVWNNEEQAVFLVFGDNTYKLKNGEKAVCANGEKKDLSFEILSDNGTMYMSAKDITMLLNQSLLIDLGFIMISGEEELYITADSRVQAEVRRAVKYKRFTGEQMYNSLMSNYSKNQYPRLHGGAEAFERIKKLIATDDLASKIFDSLKREADKGLETPPLKEDFVNNIMESEELTTLECFMWRVTGDTVYAERAWEELEAIMEFPTWSPKGAFLSVSHGICATAVGYDWLYDYLNQEQKDKLLKNLKEKGFDLAMQIYRGEKNATNSHRELFYWVTDAFNVNTDSNKNIIAACIVMAELYPDEVKTALNYAMRSLEFHFDEWEPDGAWSEGPDYGYTTLNANATILHMIESAFGEDYDLSYIPGLSEAAQHFLHILGPSGFFNFSDGNKQTVPRCTYSFYLAEKLGDKTLGYSRKKILEKSNYFTIFHELFYYDPALVGESAGEAEKDKYVRVAETTTMRSDWSDDAIFLGFHGHDNHAHHAHLDCGNFVLDAAGREWFTELGYDKLSYATGSFAETYRSRAEGHNVPIMDNSAYGNFETDEDGSLKYQLFDFENYEVGTTPNDFHSYANPLGDNSVEVAETGGEDSNKYLVLSLGEKGTQSGANFEIEIPPPSLQKSFSVTYKLKLSNIEFIEDISSKWWGVTQIITYPERVGFFPLRITHNSAGTESATAWHTLGFKPKADIWYDVKIDVNLEKGTYGISMSGGDQFGALKDLELPEKIKNTAINGIKFPVSGVKVDVSIDDIAINVHPDNEGLMVTSQRRYDQNRYASVTIDRFETTPQGSLAVSDLSEAYAAWADSTVRGVMLTDQRRATVVRDEIKLKGPTDVYWFAHVRSNTNIKVSEDGKSAILEKDDRRLWVGILSDVDGVFEVMPCKPMTGSPDPAGQDPNTAFKKLAIKNAGVTELNLSVAMIPLLGGEDVPRNIPEEVALKDWTLPQEELPKLDSLTIDGKLIEDFNPNKNVYYRLLSDDETNIPNIQATASGAEVQVKQASALPGYAVITVKKDGLESEYIVSFDVEILIRSTIQGYEISERNVVASSQETVTSGPEWTLDGDIGTTWTSLGVGNWIRYDFGKEVSLSKLQLAWYFGDTRNYNFHIQISDNAKDWKTIYSGKSSGTTDDLETYEFGTVHTGRYLRILCNGHSAGEYNNISEIR